MVQKVLIQQNVYEYNIQIFYANKMCFYDEKKTLLKFYNLICLKTLAESSHFSLIPFLFWFPVIHLPVLEFIKY